MRIYIVKHSSANDSASYYADEPIAAAYTTYNGAEQGVAAAVAKELRAGVACNADGVPWERAFVIKELEVIEQ